MKSDAALHFDCSSGISGDMTLGALVELGSRLEPGFDSEYLRKELRKLPVDGWSLDFCRDERCGITGTRALVKIDGEEPVHDHHHDGHGHHHHDHEHDHEHHDHHAHHDHHEHTHRRWKDIRAMIQDSTLGEGVKARALDIFRRIAEAEGAVHGLPPDEVAFHEVGALDSIIDIAGAAICLDALGPKRITASRIELGGGTVRCAHGVLPVPAPATLALCKGLPVSSGGFDQEMTTPTGAAILASCVDEFVVRGNFTELETACGIGTRKTGRPNVLRVSWRREESPPRESASWRTETLIQLETSVDDMTGEALG
ncbi:MAG: LarC family nickel insertion protein, partial [Treponema sp.]|nr:LarC family nickel insertion protein [Treponema sp.]